MENFEISASCMSSKRSSFELHVYIYFLTRLDFLQVARAALMGSFLEKFIHSRSNYFTILQYSLRAVLGVDASTRSTSSPLWTVWESNPSNLRARQVRPLGTLQPGLLKNINQQSLTSF